MNKEDQIAEITSTIFMYDSVNSTDEDVVRCAKHLYNIGYRKQIEAEWIRNEDGGIICSNCRYEAGIDTWEMEVRGKKRYDRSQFCHMCGAKMKGV